MRYDRQRSLEPRGLRPGMDVHGPGELHDVCNVACVVVAPGIWVYP